jgi:hypothetical protein
VDKVGHQRAGRFFDDIPDGVVAAWCGWFHETEELEAADRDEAINIIKLLVDQRMTRNPAGPLSHARAAEWYTQTLAPAAKRHNAVVEVKRKKIGQLTETWGAGWEATIDPGLLVRSSHWEIETNSQIECRGDVAG